MGESGEGDICRVCRSEGTADQPLFYPCICTGSIKFIHQECLVQWLKHSKKEYCELCMHRFSFTPIYAADMPKRLPVMDIVRGLTKSMGTAVKCWLHYTLVTFAWLGVVPVTACRMYRCLFHTSLVPLLTLPFDVFSIETVVTDILQGLLVVGSTLCAFVCLVWLREQVTHGGGPDWLEGDANRAAPGRQVPPAPVPQDPPAPAPQEPQDAPAAVNQIDANEAQPPAAVHQAVPANQGPEPAEAANGDGAEAAAAPPPAAAQNPGNNADDINWNALEWDRAAEELTWERMLGLDGSLIFLEHVLWVISLNTLFVFIFAFIPYHIGRFSTLLLGWDELAKLSRFEGVFMAMSGYVTLSLCLIIFHCVSGFLRLHQTKRILGLCYIVLKVFLLIVTEIGVLPLVCGWWLDICSLSMFNTALQDRLENFQSAPGTSMFLHWLVGMVYVFYFASFILLLREVLRPGVLWFLRNINDPEFNPIQEMIHLPVYRHVRRSLLSVIVFGSVVLLVLWLPMVLVKHTFPTFLPYHIQLSSDSPVSELSLELLLLQVVLPALLEQGHTRLWLKNLIKLWTVFVAYILDLRSYLLGDVPLEETPSPPLQHDQQLAHLDAHPDDVEHLQDEINLDAGEDEPSPEEVEPSPEEVEPDPGEGSLYPREDEAHDAPHPVEPGLHPVELDPHPMELDPHPVELDPHPVELEPHPVELDPQQHYYSYTSHARMNQGEVVPDQDLLMAAGGRQQVEGSDVDRLVYGRDENVSSGQDDADDSDVIMKDEEEEEEDTEEEDMLEDDMLDRHDDADDDNSDAEMGGGADLEQPEQEAAPAVAAPAPGGMALHAAHRALIMQMGPTDFKPFNKPSFFALRIFVLITLICLSLLLASVVCLTLPVFLGRFVMSLWVGKGVVIHELYTAACGLYLCWLVCRLATVLWSWLPAGLDLVLEKAKIYTVLFVKSLLVAAMLLGVIPFLLGLIFEVVVVVPIRVSLDQSPLFFPWQDWALGVLHAKIMCAITMMGPNWWLKNVLEQVYQDGFRNLNLGFITRRVVLPVVTCLLLTLTVPYVFAAGITPLLGFGEDVNLLVLRRIYPCLVTLVVTAVVLLFHLKQFKKLYEHIKNDKYLVGQQLVNYTPKQQARQDHSAQTTVQ